MLDTPIRRHIDPLLDRIAVKLAVLGMTANGVTWTGFALGMCAASLIATGWLWSGAVTLLVSRLCDGLDGAVARHSGGGTDLGGFLDIVLDFAFYGAIPLAFIILDPAANGMAGAVLLFTFYVNGASFLTFALMAEKQGLEDDARGSKSLLYTVGLTEATETIIAFVLFCLFPAWFPVLALIYSAMVVWTTIARFALAYRTFG
ncbi:MAG: CDP-alcohol phosphatidyltransferase family protein [Pseudomonadota bacterium]